MQGGGISCDLHKMKTLSVPAVCGTAILIETYILVLMCFT